MNNKTNKGMWRRTVGLYTKIRIPWHLYLVQTLLGFVSTRVALLYIPYQTKLQLGQVDDMSVIWSYIGLMLLVVVVSIVERIPSFYSSAMVTRNMQNKLISRSTRLPMRAFEKNASQLVSWITQDCAYADGLIGAVIGFITGIYAAYMSVTTMSAMQMSMMYLVPIIFVYIIFSTWFEGKMLFLRQRRSRSADAELTAYLSEHLSFVTQIKQLHSRDDELSRGKNAIKKFYNAEIYQALLTLAGNFVSASLQNIITIIVFVLGVPMVNSGVIEIADLANFQSYILIAYQSFSSMPSLYTSFMYYNGQLFYIAGLMDEKEEVYERERTMDIEDQDIAFENVTFGYGKDAIVKDVTFTIPKGKVTVLVGPNGSGKTTVFKLIERFYSPDSGKMYFGPYDAETIHLQEWRQSIAYVLQEPQLFDGTVRENINYGVDREVTDNDTVAAARLACADEFVRELPGGYDFEIGENGCKLSAGQRQRIAIARAVMLDPAYLLLDEATCNMDIYSEREVTEALFRLMEGRTTVMISHDMKMLDRADHVIVMNDGVIEAEGTKDEAAGRSETLRRLIAANA